MFLEQSIKADNKFWKYVVGSLLIIVASFIGNIPLVVVVFAKSFSEGRGLPTSEADVMTMLEPNLTLFLLLFSFVFTIIGLYLVVKHLHNQSFREVTTARKNVDWGRILFSFGIWSSFVIVSTAIIYFQNPENFVINFKPLPFAVLFVIGVVMFPIQTSAEEYIFRGYLMQGFANLAHNRWVPLVLTSIVFGTMHILNPEVEKMGYIVLVYYIGTGLCLGIMTLMDDGMELALGFHAANNFIGSLLLTSDWTVFQTHSILKDVSEPSAGFDVIFPVLVIFPILLFIFSKKYGWTDWIQKLTGKIIIDPDSSNQKSINTIESNDRS